jgi:hypothetical protein
MSVNDEVSDSHPLATSRKRRQRMSPILVVGRQIIVQSRPLSLAARMQREQPKGIGRADASRVRKAVGRGRRYNPATRNAPRYSRREDVASCPAHEYSQCPAVSADGRHPLDRYYRPFGHPLRRGCNPGGTCSLSLPSYSLQLPAFAGGRCARLREYRLPSPPPPP